MKTLKIIFILSIISSSVMAQRDSVFLFPEGVPGLKENNLVEQDTKSKDGLARLYGITNPCFFPMIPENADEKTPAVVICPGGGYGIVSIDSEGYNVGKWFQERGIAAFVLKYRLPKDEAFEDKSIVPLQDVQQTFKLIREKAEEYNVDVKKIGIVGFSAGGHLAASASVLYTEPLVDENAKKLRPAFSILVYPVITFTDKVTHLGTRKNLIGPEWTIAQQNYYSCEQQVDKKTPKAFLIHAQDDGAVPLLNSELYKKALDANGVKNTLVVLEEGGHGFGVKPGAKTNLWLDHLEKWLTSENLIR